MVTHKVALNLPDWQATNTPELIWTKSDLCLIYNFRCIKTNFPTLKTDENIVVLHQNISEFIYLQIYNAHLIFQ